MHSNARGKIQPYGRDWNCDRSAPDYDPQRDPWNPLSPVHGQWPRTSILREMADEPIWWGFVAWFTATASLLLLYYFNLISHDTLGIGFIGKYVVLFTVSAIAGAWSTVTWLRRTPQAERVLAYRRWLRRLPGSVAWLAAFGTICIGLEWFEKRVGVPFLLSASALLATAFAVSWWWGHRRS
jgi:hypothetical protein